MMLIRKLKFWIFALLGIVTNQLFAQDGGTNTETSTPPLQIVLPTEMDWNTTQESTEMNFQLKHKGGKDSLAVYFSIESGMLPGMKFDSLGRFSWTPSYDVADRINNFKVIPIVFEAHNAEGERTSQQVVLKVFHVNRPPVVDELKPFYVQYRTKNKYQIDPNAVTDPDGDPVVFIPLVTQMPEGMSLSAAGEITWDPSLALFKQVKERTMEVPFIIEDQPYKGRTIGKLRIEATRMDMPPSISVIPQVALVKGMEKQTVNLKFYLADPNGDDDVDTMDFVSEHPGVPKTALKRNTHNSYEFIWEPDYNFVKDPIDSLGFNITFFVLDKSKNRDEKKIRFVIQNALNVEERDKYNFSLYRVVLMEAWELLEQLKEREERLKKDYKKAKSGKRGRSMTTASLGAVTGLAPVISKSNVDTRAIITSVGGTGVATIGTLEATEIIGKSMNDIMTRMKMVMDAKVLVQDKGEVFARAYATKKGRQAPDFLTKLDEFKKALVVKAELALELNAGWESRKKLDDAALQRTFKDYVPFDK